MTQPKIAQIRAAVAEVYGLQPSDLMEGSKHRRYSGPRQLAMYLARHFTGYSWHRLGYLFGRDHTTVLFACQQVEHRRANDQTMEYAIGLLIRRLTWGSNETPTP